MEPVTSTLLSGCAAIAMMSGTPAPEDYSAQIAQQGLRATEATLVARDDPTPDDLFALGGVRFLGAVENALQTRYRFGLSQGLTTMSEIPILRLPIGENPVPEPFDPAVIEALFLAVTQDMAGAIAALDRINDAMEVGVVIRTQDLWFDINMNGTRDDCEGVLDVAGLALTGGFGPPPAGLTVRFDTADAAWLSAYAHLLSGLSETVLALQPAEAIARVTTSREAREALSPVVPTGGWFDPREMTDVVDLLAMFVYTLEGQPDAARSRAAHAHFLAMIADNRTFWSRVARETDNDAEWIPNKNQTSALGIDFPAETGPMWLDVLAELDALLRGDLLIPHFTLGQDAGINLARLMQDPPPLDIVGLVQGGTLILYMERGPRISGQALARFDDMLLGDAPLFMLILN